MRSAQIDLSAIAHNLRLVAEAAGDSSVLADVSADGYGHGALQVAGRVLEAGAHCLVVATVAEGVALREAGIDASILAWQLTASGAFDDAARNTITPAVSSPAQLVAAASSGCPSVHLAAAIGDGMVGCRPEQWGDLVDYAARVEQDGELRVVGIMGCPARRTPHSRTDLTGIEHDQIQFERRLTLAREAGLAPRLVHLDGSAAALAGAADERHAVRIGRAMYGLSPFGAEGAAALGLRQAMQLDARVLATKTVAAGEGISYGYTYRTAAAANLALVGIGYAHGVDRSASNRCTARLNGWTYPIAGRIAMDVFVLDLGRDTADVGDLVTLFGDPDAGCPSVEEWAALIGKSSDEIVTAVAPQVARLYR